MMNKIFTFATYLFDPLHLFWERDRTQRFVGGILVVVFLLALLGIEIKREGWFGDSLAWFPYDNHFMAVNLAFTLVLILEVISLIFTLPCSISKAVSKQFEILALILLRGTFKQLIYFPEPIRLEGNIDLIWPIVTDGLGAVIIFALLGVYRLLLRKDEEVKKGETLFKFVAAKKIVALGMLGLFAGMFVTMCWQACTAVPVIDFFPAFYTVLIFSDILLVLIAQRYLPRFRAVFRNSAFALATLFIRLALTAPDYYNALFGVGAAVYAVLLTLVYNMFYAPKPNHSKFTNMLKKQAESGNCPICSDK